MSTDISTDISTDMSTDSQSVLIAGASGLVGSALLQQLLDDPSKTHVYALVRKPLGLRHSKLIECHFDTAFNHWVDEAYICLGTTLKKAGSQTAFSAVDHDLCLSVAQTACAAGAKRLAMVSSLGANPDSSGFYLQVKGKAEAAVQSLAQLNQASTVFIRPSFLMGDRSEYRLGERFALLVAKAFNPLIPTRYKPVQADSVAQAMIHALRDLKPHTHLVLESGSW